MDEGLLGETNEMWLKKCGTSYSEVVLIVRSAFPGLVMKSASVVSHDLQLASPLGGVKKIPFMQLTVQCVDGMLRIRAVLGSNELRQIVFCPEVRRDSSGDLKQGFVAAVQGLKCECEEYRKELAQILGE